MKNLEQIHELKREQVETLCSIVASYDIIKRLIIFGSSATADCQESSDIDICLDILCDTKDMRLYHSNIALNKACDYNCDIVIYNRIGNNLKSEIDKKGVVVYET